MNNKDIIKNPINYTGSKNRLLPIILPNLPQGCSTIVEPFGGTFEVSLNTDFENKIYNDKNRYLYMLIELFKKFPVEHILQYLEGCISQHHLSKFDKEAFYEFRDDFNEYWFCHLLDNNDSGEFKNIALIRLLALIYHSFNYFITFNKDGKYMNTSGYGRSSFNDNLKQKMIKYCEVLQDKRVNVELNNMDFREFYFKLCKKYDFNFTNVFFFVDPVYINSDDTYRRNSNISWTVKDEEEVYNMLDEINKLGGKFMLTNTIECNGVKNEQLETFSQKYKTISTDCDFYGCSYQRKNNKTREVIVKNY